MRHQLFRGSFIKTANVMAQMAIAFFMMPFLVHGLGNRHYGIWVVIGAFTGYFGLLDLGLSKAVNRFISRAAGQRNDGEINEIVNTGLALYSILGLISFGAALVIAGMVPRFVAIPSEYRLIQLLVVIVGLDFALSFPIRLFYGVLEGNLRFEVVTGSSMVRSIISVGLIVWAVRNGYGLLSLAVIQFLCSQVQNLFLVIYTSKKFPEVRFNRYHLQLRRIRSFFSYSLYAFVTQVADLLRFKVDAFVIAGFLGAASVTVYFIASRLIEYMISIMSNLMSVLTPAFSRMEGQGRMDELRERFIFTSKISVVLSLLMGGGCLVFGRSFITRWMGPDYSEAYLILAVLVVPISIALSQLPSINLLYGISKHSFYSYANSVEGAANLILSLLLVKPYGLLGVAAGTAIPMIIIKLFIQPVYVCRSIELPLTKYIAEVVKTIGIAGGCILFGYLIVRSGLKPDYLIILSLGFVFVLSYAFPVYFLVFDSNERKTLGSLRLTEAVT